MFINMGLKEIKIYSKGDYRVHRIYTPEASSEQIQEMQLFCEMSLESRSENYSYKRNYIWDSEDPATLAFKLRARNILHSYWVYYKDKPISLSHTFINKSLVLFAGYRRISTTDSPFENYHIALVVQDQFEVGRQIDAKAIISSYNVGSRTGYFLALKRLFQRESTNQFNKEAHEFLRQHDFKFVEEPHNVNHTAQHFIYHIYKDSNFVELASSLSDEGISF